MGSRKAQSSTTRTFLLLCGATLLAFAGFIYYSSWAAAQKARLSVSIGDSPTDYHLAIASTPAERAKGLMFVRELEPNTGMIFVFADSKVQTFWMKNTFVSLDLLFIDENFTLVGIVERTTPQSTARLSVEKPSKFVIELAAGTVARHGIKRGDKVTPHGPLPLGIPDDARYDQ